MNGFCFIESKNSMEPFENIFLSSYLTVYFKTITSDFRVSKRLYE